MGCDCCKKRKLFQKLFLSEDEKNELDGAYEMLETPENKSTDYDSNPTILKVGKDKGKKVVIKNDKNKDEIKEEIEVKEMMLYESVLKDYLDENIDGTEIFDKKWYSDIEREKIVYSKRAILALVKATFEDKNKEFKELYNKPPLLISVNSNGSFISKEFQVVRTIYTVDKSIFPPNTTLKMIFKYLNYIKERSSWDPQIKSYSLLEGSEEGKEVKCIVRNWLKSPMFLVSERDIVEKRYEFFHDGKFYAFDSSVNDNLYPPEEDVTRIYDIIFIEELSEENNNIILKGITQMDTKVTLPQSMVNATLSIKLLDFYKNLVEAMNKDFQNGNLIFEDNNGNIITSK
jgi:hypothetical protein